MGLLNQKENEYAIYIGWYGDRASVVCGDCNAVDLSSFGDKLYAVYQFSEGGRGIKSFLSSAPVSFQNFTELQCGKMYWIVLNPGVSSIDIPDFVHTFYSDEESSLGHLQLCEPNPTPTPTPPTGDFIELHVEFELSHNGHNDVFLPIYDIADSGRVVIDWGDDSVSYITSDVYETYNYIGHRYDERGIYVIKITGDFETFDPDRSRQEHHDESTFTPPLPFFEARKLKISGMPQLKRINLKSFVQLTELSFSDFVASEDFSLRLGGCGNLTSVDFGNFDNSSFPNYHDFFNSLFYNCTNLTNVNFGNLDISFARDLSNMFYGCSSLTSIDLSNFNTSKIERMDRTFYGCSSLNNLDLSHWCVFQFKSEPVGFGWNAPFYENENNRPRWGNWHDECTGPAPTPTPTPTPPLDIGLSYVVNNASDVTHDDATLSFTVLADGQLFSSWNKNLDRIFLALGTEDGGRFDFYAFPHGWETIIPSSCFLWDSVHHSVDPFIPETLSTGTTIELKLSDLYHGDGCPDPLTSDTTYYFRFVVASQAIAAATDNERFTQWTDLGTFTTLPEPTPTPTPMSTQGCCPNQASVFKTFGGADIQAYEYTPSGENTLTLLTWQGFDDGGKLCVDLTLTDGWSEQGFEITKAVYLNSTSNPQIGTIRKMMSNGSDRGAIYYTDGSGKCYHGDYSSNPVVLSEIDSVFGETPTPLPGIEPTPEPVSSPSGPMDFDEKSSEYEDLPIEQKGELDEIHGVVTYIPLEGGFYGIISKTNNGDYLHYLPINIQEDLIGHDGTRILVRSSYTDADMVSIFQWGTLIYVNDMELEVPEPGPIGCFKDLRPCGDDGEFVVRDPKLNCNFPPCFFDMDEFYYMKKFWQMTEPSSYQYTFAWGCFCPEEVSKQVIITVHNNEIYSIHDMDGQVVENGESWFRYYTMSDLYEFVELEFKKFPHTMSAQYDEFYTLKSWFVDKDLMIVDEERSFYVTNFRKLDIPGPGCQEDARVCPSDPDKESVVLVRDPELDCNFPPCKFNKDKFYHAWKTWSEYSQPTPMDSLAYEYTFRWICYCDDITTQEVRITVDGGELVSVTDMAGNPVEVTSSFGYHTMTELYEFIEDELTTFPYLMWFEYNEATGALTEWSVDRNPMIADEELGFAVSDFTII